MPRKHYISVKQYLADFDGEVKARLLTLRELILDLAPPGILESIKYNIPCFISGKNRVYLAGYTHHVSIYPVPPLAPKWQPYLVQHQKGKGTLQFSVNKFLPLDFIRQVITILLIVGLK